MLNEHTNKRSFVAKGWTDETRKGGIKGAQETLTAMMAGFKVLRRKTKPR